MDVKTAWILRFVILFALTVACFYGPKWAKETDKDGRIIRRYPIVSDKIASKVMAFIFLLGSLAALYSIFAS